MMTLKHVALLVDDYEVAIDWLARCLCFALIEDMPIEGKRWITMQPAGGGCSLVLAKAKNGGQQAYVG